MYWRFSMRFASVNTFKSYEARLPERPRRKPSRHGDFECLYGYRHRSQLRLAYQQVYVFRHDNVSIDRKTVIGSDTFEEPLKHLARVRLCEVRLATVTGKRG